MRFPICLHGSGSSAVRSGGLKNAGEILAALDELEVVIEKLVAGGDGLARHGGVPIFVPLAAPGDRLWVRLVERRPGYGRAEILEVREGGPDRRELPCPHFGPCGGCSLQHVADEAQTRLRVEAAREALTRISGLPMDVPEEVIAGAPWGYRVRAQLQLEDAPGAARVGYFRRRSHDLIELSACPVLAPPLERFVLELPELLTPPVPRRLDVALGDEGSLSCGPVLSGLPRGEILRRVGAAEYAFDARTFFQGHQELLPRLVDTVVGTHTGESVYDLYAGVGLFSVPLAARYRRLVAVEGDRVAARYARKNLQRNRCANGTVEIAAVDSWISRLPQAVARVVVDPPRAGLGPRVRRVLAEKRPQRITYVSCHPAALARDLAALARSHALERVSYVDLFPQTGHIEIVADLRAAT